MRNEIIGFNYIVFRTFTFPSSLPPSTKQRYFKLLGETFRLVLSLFVGLGGEGGIMMEYFRESRLKFNILYAFLQQLLLKKW